MELTFDFGKDAASRKKHGISLSRAKDLDFEHAYITVDDREDYNETRFRAISFINAKLYVLVFVETEHGIRAISLREAEKIEAREYAENQR